MEKFKCPHCGEEIELSEAANEVAKKQAKLLAAQEIKAVKENTEKSYEKERKQKDLEIQKLKQDRKKDLEAVTAVEKSKKIDEIKQIKKESEQERPIFKY